VRLSTDSSKPLALVLTAVCAALATGCGRGDENDLVAGKTRFVQKCGSCHTLGRAGTKGVQGPNLDEAFRTARRNGLGAKTIQGVVRDQISHVRRGSIMPRDLVTGAKARDVAAYVALVAGKAGKDTGALAQAGQAKGSGKTAKAKNGTLQVDADPTGALAFTAGKATAPAGKLAFVMKNEASIMHDIAVKGGGAQGKGPVVGKGGTSRFSVTLTPGSYEFYCTVPGHEAGGMKGTLTVK
jgi:uncharacterized cupredoxin-like copper-binding protein